jgi:hypothetical protein
VSGDSGRDAVGVTDARELDNEAIDGDSSTIDFGLPEASANDATAGTDYTIDELQCQLINGVWWAMKDYPGRTKLDLSRGHSVVCGLASNTPNDFDCGLGGLLVKDGSIAVGCGSTLKATSVHVLMPSTL